jgi:type IV pilus assembly protein PilF
MTTELREHPERTYVAADPARVVSLYLSSNQPHVQAGGRTAQSAQAAVVGLQLDDGRCEVAVGLHLFDAGENVVFVAGPMPAQVVPDLLEQAVLFAESMGFLLDDAGWARLPDEQRDELLASSGIFRPPQPRAVEAPAERARPKDPLAALARLFAAFALLLLPSALGCATGMSAEQRTKDAEIHYELGTNYLQNGDAQSALKEFLIAVQSNPEMPQPHAGLGFVYAFSLNNPAEAEVEFRRAIDLDPTFSDALNNFGAFYLSRERYAEAVPLFERALGNPLYAERFIAEGNLGWALYKTGKVDKGIARLRGAVLVAPKYCKGWRELGTIYSETGKLDEAVIAFGKYAASCPDAPDAHLQNGKVLARASRADEARTEFAKCAKAPPAKDAASVSECERFLKELGAPQ